MSIVDPRSRAVALPDELESVDRLAMRWLASIPAPATRLAYSRHVVGSTGSSTKRRQAFRVASWLVWCEARSIDPLRYVEARGSGTVADLYRFELVERYSRNSTVARMAAVAMWHDWLLTAGVIDRHPWHAVKRPRSLGMDATAKHLDAEQFADLEAAVDVPRRRGSGSPLVVATDRALIAVLALDGCRISEALALDIGPILASGKGKRAVLVPAKGGKVRRVRLASAWPEVSALIDVIGERSGPLFRSKRGGPLSPGAAGSRLARLGRVAGIDGRVHPHELRHTNAMAAIYAGATVEMLKVHLGHASIATTETYARLSADASGDVGAVVAGVLRPNGCHNNEEKES